MESDVPLVAPVRSSSLLRQNSSESQNEKEEEAIAAANAKTKPASEEEQFEELKTFSTFIDNFFDALLPRGVEHDYRLLIAILLQIKESKDTCHDGMPRPNFIRVTSSSLNRFCVCAGPRHNHNLYKLAEMAQLLLQKRYQGQEWSEPHQGSIMLPPGMYAPLKEAEMKNLRKRYLPESYGAELLHHTKAHRAAPNRAPKKDGTPKRKRDGAEGGASKSSGGGSGGSARAVKKVKTSPPASVPERKAPSRKARDAIPKQLDMTDAEFEATLEASEAEKHSAGSETKTNGSAAHSEEDGSDAEIDLRPTKPAPKKKTSAASKTDADGDVELTDSKPARGKKSVAAAAADDDDGEDEPAAKPPAKPTPKKTPKKSPVKPAQVSASADEDESMSAAPAASKKSPVKTPKKSPVKPDKPEASSSRRGRSKK